MVYDAPKLKMEFEKRYAKLILEEKKNANKYWEVVEQSKVKDIEEVHLKLDQLTSQGAEGVMLKDPTSMYEQTRSNSLLKVKKFEDDEAVVIGHLKGTGRCSSMMGAI